MDFFEITLTIITTMIGGLIMTWMIGANMRRKDSWSAGITGIIHPNRLQFCALALLGLILTAGFGYGIYHSYMTFLYGRLYLFVPGTLAFGVMTWSSLCFAFDPACRVEWDTKALTGPVNYWFYPFGPRRASMHYDEIAALGVDRWDSFCVWNDAGTAIRWSYYYKGFAALNAQIEAQRPDLISDWVDEDEDDYD